MNVSETNLNKLKILIKELYELSCILPDISKNVLSTNINYRLFLLEEWTKDYSQEINYEIDENNDEGDLK